MNDKTNLLPKLLSRIPRATSRRQALKGLGLGALGLAATKLLTTKAEANGATVIIPTPQTPPSATNMDTTILNFALNLEYLEAQFYTYATLGTNIQTQGIAGNGVGTQGPVVIKANPTVPFVTSAIQQYAFQIAEDERAHVQFLRNALGNKAVAQPRINLQSSFTNMAIMAGIIPEGATFDPFGDELSFLLGAYFFEDVGVTAYRGVLTSITNNTFLTQTAGLMGTEAYHAANIRTKVFEYNTTAQNISVLISNLRASLDGTGNDDQGVVLDGSSNIILTNGNGLVFSRTMQQALDIFYLAQNATKGGFFPNGINHG